MNEVDSRPGRQALSSAFTPLMTAGLAAPHAWSAEGDRAVGIDGFAQADAFRPSKIANPEGIYRSNGQASVSVKQSRFGVKGTMPTAGFYEESGDWMFTAGLPRPRPAWAVASLPSFPAASQSRPSRRG